MKKMILSLSLLALGTAPLLACDGMPGMHGKDQTMGTEKTTHSAHKLSKAKAAKTVASADVKKAKI